jgi:hypothetical protein
MPNFYIQVGVIVDEGKYDATDEAEAIQLGLKAREEMKKIYGHLGAMWYDVEKLENDPEDTCDRCGGGKDSDGQSVCQGCEDNQEIRGLIFQ